MSAFPLKADIKKKAVTAIDILLLNYKD